MEDNEIVELFLKRSDSAIAELSNKYGKYLKTIALNILNNELDAEECVNDTFLAVWNTVPPQTPDPLLTYICRIVRNLALKKYHSNTATKRNSTYDIALDELIGCFPSDTNVENEVDSNETVRMINHFLETLNEQDRMIFIRRYWYSDSIKQIADIFGKSEHYISVRLFRIRNSLKQFLIEEGVSF